MSGNERASQACDIPAPPWMAITKRNEPQIILKIVMQISSHDGNCPDRTDYSPIPAKGVQKGKHPSLRAMFDYKTCFRVFSCYWCCMQQLCRLGYLHRRKDGILILLNRSDSIHQ